MTKLAIAPRYAGSLHLRTTIAPHRGGSPMQRINTDQAPSVAAIRAAEALARYARRQRLEDEEGEPLPMPGGGELGWRRAHTREDLDQLRTLIALGGGLLPSTMMERVRFFAAGDAATVAKAERRAVSAHEISTERRRNDTPSTEVAAWGSPLRGKLYSFGARTRTGRAYGTVWQGGGVAPQHAGRWSDTGVGDTGHYGINMADPLPLVGEWERVILRWSIGSNIWGAWNTQKEIPPLPAEGILIAEHDYRELLAAEFGYYREIAVPRDELAKGQYAAFVQLHKALECGVLKIESVGALNRRLDTDTDSDSDTVYLDPESGTGRAVMALPWLIHNGEILTPPPGIVLWS